MVKISGRSVCGPGRTNNEDSFDYRFVGEHAVMAVADGLGGCPYGEVASSIAVSSSLGFIEQNSFLMDDEDDMRQMLDRAFNAANIDILRDCVDNPGHMGMCSTLTVAVITGTRLFIAHYGDCRCYLVHGSDFQQMTEDHNLAAYLVKTEGMTPEQASADAGRSRLINCLGENKFVRPDVNIYNISYGDCVILSSDGMYELFDEDTRRMILRNRNDLDRMCDLLMERGVSVDSKDNSTVVVARVTPGRPEESYE